MPISFGDAVVYLIADDEQLKAGLRNAQSFTDSSAASMGGAFNVLIGNLMTSAVTTLASAVTTGIGEMTGAFTAGIAGAVSLDAQLASIAAKMGKTKDDVMPLKQLIFDLALDPNLVVNTTQAAEAIEMLAGNGASLDAIFGGLAASTVALANATGNNFGLAAEVATSSMDLFKLKADDLQLAFDGIVGVTTATKFSLNDYKLALSAAGGVVSQMGVELTDFNTVIAGTATSFASGSDAGTSLKTVMQRMALPTKDMQQIMTQYGISIYNTTGELRPMGEIVGQLNGVLSGAVTTTSSVTTATNAMGESVVLTAKAQKEMEKAQEDAAKKMPQLQDTIDHLNVSLGINETKLNAMTAAGRGALGGDPEWRQLAETIRVQKDNLGEATAQMQQYQIAMGGVTNAQTSTTTSVRVLTEAEKAHILTVLGGADGARMLGAMANMTQKEYEELSAEVNKSGLAFATAKTQVDSVQGAFDIFWGVIEAVQLQIGDALLPMIRQLTEVFTVFASVAAPIVVGGFGAVSTAIETFLTLLLPSAKEFNDAFGDGGVSGMMGAWIEKIVGLVIPLNSVTAGMTSLTNSADYMSNLNSGISGFNIELQRTRTLIDSYLGDGASNFFASLVPAIQAVYVAFRAGGIGEALGEIVNQITNVSPLIQAAFMNWGSNVWAWIEPVLSAAPSQALSIVTAIGNGLLGGYSVLIALVTQLFLAIPDALAAITPDPATLQGLGDSIAQGIMTAFSGAISSAEGASDGIITYYSALGNAFLALVGAFYTVASNIAIGFGNALFTEFSKIDVGTILSEFLTQLSSFSSVFTLDTIVRGFYELKTTILDNKGVIDGLMGTGWAKWFADIALGIRSVIIEFRENGFTASILLIRQNIIDFVDSLNTSGIYAGFASLNLIIIRNKETIDEWLGAGWADAFSNIVSYFISMVDSFRNSGFGETVTTMMGTVLGALGGGAISAVFSSLATSLAPLIPVVGSVVGSFSGLGAWFTTVGAGLIPLLTYIGAGFSTLYAAIASSGVVTTLGTFANLALAPVIAQITLWGTTIAAYMSTFLAFGSFLATTIGGMITSIPMVTPMITFMSSAITFFAGALAPLMGFLTPLLGGLGSFGGLLALMINPITLVGVAIVALGALWGSNFTQMNEIAVKVYEYLLPTWDKLKIGFDGFLLALAPSIPAFTQLADVFIAALPSMQILAGIILGGLVVGIGKIGDIIGAILPSLGMLINGLVTGLSGGLSGVISFIDGTIQMIYGLLTEGFKSEVAYQGAMKIVEGIKTAFLSLGGGLVTIGGALLQGLADGITAAFPIIGTGLSSLVTYIITTIKGWLGIQSPSTVFAEIGNNLVLGLVDGLIGLGTALSGMWVTIEPILSEWGIKFWGWATTALANAPSAIGALVSSLGGYISTAWATVEPYLVSWGVNFWNWSTNALAQAPAAVGGLIEGIGTGLSTAWSMLEPYILEWAVNFWNWLQTVIDGIPEQIGSLISSIGEFLGQGSDILGGIWSEVWAYVLELTSEAVSGVADYVQPLIDDTVALITDGSDMLSEAWSAGWEYVSEITGEVVDYVIEYVSSFVDYVIEYVGGVGDTIGELWGAGWEMISNLTSDTIDTVLGYVQTLYDGAVELIGGAMDTVSGLWDSGWAMMSDGVDGIISTIYDLISGFSDESGGTLDSFMETAMTLWDAGWNTIYELADGLLSSIYDGIDSFYTDASGVWDELSSYLQETWDIAWNYISETVGSILETVGGVIDGAYSYISGVWDSLGAILSTVWSAAWGVIETLMGTSSGNLSNAMGAVYSALSAIWQTLSDYLNTAWTVAWGLIGTIAETTWNTLGTGVTALSTMMQGIWETVSSAMSTAWDLAWTAMGTIYDTVSGKLKDTVSGIADSVYSAMSTASNTISTIWNGAWTTALTNTTRSGQDIILKLGEFMTNAKTKFGEYVEDWFEAGNNIMDGIMDGVIAKEEALLAYLYRMAYRALNTVLDALQMHSPSQVFQDEVGVQIVAGMIEGVDMEAPALFDSVGNLATGVVDAAVSGISGARDAIGGIFGGAFGEYISTNISATVGQAVQDATINLQGIESTLKQNLSLMNNNTLSQETRMEAFTREFAKSMSDLDTQYQTMLKSGMNPDEALAQYTASANKLKEIAQAAALSNNAIRKGVEQFQQTGNKNSRNSFYNSIAIDIDNAIESASLMKKQQIGLSDVFSFELGDIKEQMSVNINDILNSATTEAARLNEKFINRSKEDSTDDPVKILKDLTATVTKGIADSSKEMVDSTKKMLASGMSPKEAMAQYVNLTKDAYALLQQDTIVKELPETVREGKRVLQEAYQDILNTVDSQFIGATKSKLSEAGKLFKQGLSDGLDISTVMSVFNESMTSISESMKDEFIQGMPTTLANANGLMNEQYRKMKDDLEKGLVSGTKDGMKKAGEALTQGIKEGLDPAQLIANYRQTASLMQQGFTDELVSIVPQGVSDATKAIDDASDKLLGSLTKDFVGGVKTGLGTAENDLKKAFSNMSDPSQAQGFIDTYLASIGTIKESFKTGIPAMIPDALNQSQGLTNVSAGKMTSEISKTFIKSAKDKFKDMQEEIKKGLESGIHPTGLMANFNALQSGLKAETEAIKNTIKTNLGQDVPKDLAAMTDLWGPELEKARETIEKSLTGNIKNKMSEASATMKEGIKKGLSLEELVATYRNTGEELRKHTQFSEFAGVADTAIQTQLKSTKDFIESEFGKEVKGSIKGITTSLKNSLTLDENIGQTLQTYKNSLVGVNTFITSDLGKSMPQAMAEASQAVKDNYEDIFGAIGKQAKSKLAEAKAAYKFDLSEGLITPEAARAKYDAVFSEMSSVINNELGRNAPLAVHEAKGLLADSLSDVGELLKKSLVDRIKDKLGEASKAFKEGLKDGFKTPKQLYEQWQAEKTASEGILEGLDATSAAYKEQKEKIANTNDDMIQMLTKDLVGGVKDSMTGLKNSLKENLDFGGSVKDALARLETDSKGFVTEFEKGVGGTIPDAMTAANAQIETQRLAILKTLGGKYVSEIKGNMKDLANNIKENLSFGGTVGEALKKLQDDAGALSKGIITGLDPQATAEAKRTIDEQQTDILKMLGGKFIDELKDSLKNQSEAVKLSISQGVSPTEAMAKFKTSIDGTMAGMSDELKAATPNLARMATGLVEAATTELSKLGGLTAPAGLSELGKSLLGSVGTGFTEAKKQLEEKLKFGGTVAEGLAQFKADMAGLSSIIANEIGTKAPEAMSQAQEKLRLANEAGMKSLAAKSVSELGEYLKSFSTVFKKGGELIDPITGQLADDARKLELMKEGAIKIIANIPKDVAAAVPGVFDEARQALANQIGSITKMLPPAYDTLAVGVVGATVNATSIITQEVQKQIDLAKTAVGTVVSNANKQTNNLTTGSTSPSTSSGATTPTLDVPPPPVPPELPDEPETTRPPNFIDEMIAAMKAALPDLDKQGNEFIAKLLEIKDKVLTMLKGKQSLDEQLADLVKLRNNESDDVDVMNELDKKIASLEAKRDAMIEQGQNPSVGIEGIANPIGLMVTTMSASLVELQGLGSKFNEAMTSLFTGGKISQLTDDEAAKLADKNAALGTEATDSLTEKGQGILGLLNKFKEAILAVFTNETNGLFPSLNSTFLTNVELIKVSATAYGKTISDSIAQGISEGSQAIFDKLNTITSKVNSELANVNNAIATAKSSQEALTGIAQNVQNIANNINSTTRNTSITIHNPVKQTAETDLRMVMNLV